MEALAVHTDYPEVAETVPLSSSKPTSFIEANTIPITLQEIKEKNIIPVFSKDNEPVISHLDFIEATYETAERYFSGAKLLQPQIRVSHPVKGRIPDARNKPANELLDHERTLYYERMAFTIELPEVSREIWGNKLTLVLGGVKAYNEDNLFNKKGTPERFKLFIGFQNKVCLNLKIWTDGLKDDIRVTSAGDLRYHIHQLISNYDAIADLIRMEAFAGQYITEHQFAQLIGKAKLYNYLPVWEKKTLPAFQFPDSHLNIIANDYYSNNSFCRNPNGNISLWRLYNLFTGATKNSYIDLYLNRSLTASNFISYISEAIKSPKKYWFID